MRYLKLTVVKKLEGTVYVAVPDEFVKDENKAMHWMYQDSVGEAAEAQVESVGDWSQADWEHNVEVENVTVVTKEEAELGCTRDTIPELKQQEE